MQNSGTIPEYNFRKIKKTQQKQENPYFVYFCFVCNNRSQLDLVLEKKGRDQLKSCMSVSSTARNVGSFRQGLNKELK